MGGGDDLDPDPVAGFLSWCSRVGLELSPKVSGVGREAEEGAARAGSDPLLPCRWR